MIIYYIILIVIIFTCLYSKSSYKESFDNQKLDMAVIVEPREHKYLIPVVNNVIDNVPKDTKIQIFHGTKNLDYIKTHFKSHIQSNKIILTNLNVENLTLSQYSNLLTSKSFWNSIPGENILIFQTDSCICNKSPHKINQFLKFNYIGGVSWKKLSENNNTDYNHLNGGFSFRKKSFMLDCIHSSPSANMGEDSFFSKCLLTKKQKVPTNKDSLYFSNDNGWSNYETPFGIHKIWSLHDINDKQYLKIKQNCPEISSIFGK